jgi:hypothetical protein
MGLIAGRPILRNGCVITRSRLVALDDRQLHGRAHHRQRDQRSPPAELVEFGHDGVSGAFGVF